jgi:hypothetical protein
LHIAADLTSGQFPTVAVTGDEFEVDRILRGVIGFIKAAAIRETTNVFHSFLLLRSGWCPLASHILPDETPLTSGTPFFFRRPIHAIAVAVFALPLV